MSTTGPTPARLEELRRRFEDAAFDSPNMGADVIYKPAFRQPPGEGSSTDRVPFFKGFFQYDGELATAVNCWTVPAPPYWARVGGPAENQFDWEGLIRTTWSEDAHAERPRWWCSLRYFPGLDRPRFEMLATTAIQLIFGDAPRENSPTFEWLVHLAERAGDLDPTSQRLVILTSPFQPRAGAPTFRGPVRFEECPPEVRRNATRFDTPSWWAVGLHNLFWLSRNAVDRMLARLEAPDKPDTSNTGRKPAGNKDAMRERVRILRAAGEKWRNVYTTINKEFGTSYEYSRSGSLQKLIAEGK